MIALLTDFGTKDHYVGVMKAVMKGIRPQAEFVDITHDIPPQDVRAAAFTLMNVVQYFPKGTVFLVVVDPGVGTQRRPVIVWTKDYTFIAPDNGVLSYALRGTDYTATTLSNPGYRLKSVSNTFHGRDIFSPAAAHAANGVTDFGEPLGQLTLLLPPKLEIGNDRVIGEVIYIDHFGNLITSIGPMYWHDEDMLHLQPDGFPVATHLSAGHTTVNVGRHTFDGIRMTFRSVEVGEAVVLVGSSGYLEVDINAGHAAQALAVPVGDPVSLIFEEA